MGRLKKDVKMSLHKLIALSPIVNMHVLVIGGGCGGALIAARLKNLGFGQVTLFTKSFFGIKDCTVKVSQLHLSGLEYINDLDSAKALIAGGLEFISLFGKNGWEQLVQLGILEKEGTQFKFTEETLRQQKPSAETVRKNLPKLELFYDELKTHYPNILFPEKLFTTISNKNPNNLNECIDIQSIQPGIAIMRLGALLKNHLSKHNIEIIQNDFFKTTIQKTDTTWIVDGIVYDILINATNGAYQQINEFIKRQTQTDALKTHVRHVVKNHRYQLYVEGKPTYTTPSYTLCTTNANDPSSAFLGCMVDRTGIQTLPNGSLKTCYILYAAGPSENEIQGGGSWGNTGLQLHEEIQKDPQTEETVRTKIIQSVQHQFHKLQTAELSPLFLHNGYNINVLDAQCRSDVRPLMHPELNLFSPLLITAFCLKFTHSALTSKITNELIISTLEEKGYITDKQTTDFHKKNTEFEIELEDSETHLTEATLKFCKEANIPHKLAHYLSASKTTWHT